MEWRLRWGAHLWTITMMIVADHLVLGYKCSIQYKSKKCPTMVKYVNQNLTKVPNWIPSNVTCLDLSGNPLLQLQEDSFVGFAKLTHLSLRNCALSQSFIIPRGLESINLEYNSFSIENIAAIFKEDRVTQLIVINLNRNRLHLDGKLSILPKAAKCLNLNGNKLSKIKEDDFKGYDNLTHLHLASNQIQNISKRAFCNLKNLYYLDLSNNSIKELRPRLFMHNPRISEIYMTNNYLRRVPDLTGIQSLFILHVARNRIQTVTGSSFGIRVLSKIDLAYNEIKHFDFTGLTYRFLDLSNTKISKIGPGSLGKTQYIGAIVLHGNSISSISYKCFEGLHFINELHLQSNKLQQIERGTFRNITVERLLLFNNNLTKMDGVLEGMKKPPHLLLLFGNPNISIIRACDYQNMSKDSKIFISCRSITTFSFPFFLKAQLMCIPARQLVIHTAARGLEGNGFWCKSANPYKCYPCKQGEYDAGRYHIHGWSCIHCPYGAFYQDEIASIECKKCPLGQFVPPERGPGKSALDCLTCPKGTNTNKSAGYRACFCLPGYSRKYRFGGCERCSLKGFQCQRDYPQLKAGYWMSWENRRACKDSFLSFMSNLDTTNDSYNRNANHIKCNLPVAHKCPIAKSCKGGVEASCTRGYTGVLCASCHSGYMKQYNRCVKCSSPVISVVECVAYLLSFVMLCLVISKLDNVTLAGKENDRNQRTFADLIQSSLKIMMGFYQVLVRIINAFASIQWPKTLTHAVKVFEFVEFSVLRIPSLHCIRSDWRLNAIGEFWISLIAMVTIPSLILICFALNSVISYFTVSQENFTRKQKALSKNCLQSAVLFFFATYPFISTKILHVLPASCHTFCTVMEDDQCLNKKSYLRNDYNVECPTTTSGRGFNVSYAYASLLLPIGLPFLLLYLLWTFAPKEKTKAQQDRHLNIQYLDSQENEDQYYMAWEDYSTPLVDCEEARPGESSIATVAIKMTYGNYKTTCWYWEFIEMIRKLFMVIASSFFVQNLKVGLYSNILLSVFFVLLHARKWPMKDRFDNYMQLLALVSVTVNLCYSVTKTSSIGNADMMDNDKDIFVLGLMLVSLNSLLVILIVGRFAKEVCMKLAQKLGGVCCP